MFMAKVLGNVVTTQKVQEMTGRKLLIVDPMVIHENHKALKSTGKQYIAVDTVGSGTGDMVMVTQGSSARMTESTGTAPVDCVIIGMIDTINVESNELYRKSAE